MEKRQGIEKYSDVINIAASFLFNAAVLLLCALVLAPRALNNDDSIIHAITAGAYGEASAVTVHTNIVFALLLRLLQFLFSGVNWLAAIEVFSIYIAFSLTGSLLLLKNPGWFGRALALFSGVVIAPSFYIGLHNTKLAPVIAVAGFAALFYGIQNKKNLFSALGWVLVLISSFLRLNAFLIGVAFAGGIGIVLLLRGIGKHQGEGDTVFLDETDFLQKPNVDGSEEGMGLIGAASAGPSPLQLWWRKNKRMVVSFIILFAVVFGFVGLDILLVEQTPGGMEYREYNLARGVVSDFALPDYAENADGYRALGVSENDYALIEQWNFADLEKFDAETLRGIAAMREPESFSALFSRFFSEIGASLSNPFFLVALGLIVLCFFFSDKGGRWIAGWSLLAFLLCLFYMCAIGRTTHWVFSSLYGCLSLMALAAIDTRGKKQTLLLKIILPAAVAAFALILSPILYAKEVGNYKESFNMAAGEIYTTLGEEHEENLYLFDHMTYPANEIHRIVPTFSAIPEGYFKNSYSLGGWDTDSPAKNSILSRYNVEGSPYRALLEKDNVFLADTKNYGEKLTYIRENYDANAMMSLYDVIDGYYIFAFSNTSFDAMEIEPDEELTIGETAVSVDGTLPDFLYIGIAVDGEFGAIGAAYVNLYPLSGGAVRSYQGRVIERAGGVTVVLSIPLTDALDVGEYEVDVVFKTAGGIRATEIAPLA